MDGEEKMRRVVWVAVVGLAVALGAWAQDPWKGKPYTQWDAKDVEKVLKNSPWVQRVHVSAPWKQRGGTDASGREAVVVGGTAGRGQTGGQAQTGMSTGATGRSELEQARPPEALYYIRWASARMVRQGIIRGAMLAGRVAEADAERYLSEPPEGYEIVIESPEPSDMAPFRRLDEMALKEKAYLRTKKTKQKLSPARVTIERTADGRGIAAIVFLFPKQTPSGEPVLPPGEEGAEFVCSTNDVSFKSNFDFRKMGTKEGLDL
jgi:hypothetical protein